MQHHDPAGHPTLPFFTVEPSGIPRLRSVRDHASRSRTDLDPFRDQAQVRKLTSGD
jgi:hypothetical protein